MFGNTFIRLNHPKSLNLTLLNIFQCPKTGNEGDCCNKANAIDGKIEVVVVDDRGSNYQPISTSFANVPILGDGSGGNYNYG